MAIPDFQTVMLPLLRFASDEQEHSLREAVDALSNEFGLSDEERRELLPSGRQEVFHNRVGWARTYMAKAGLLESTRRGYFRVTQRGLAVLASNPARIDVKFLTQFDEFQQFRALRHTRATDDSTEAAENETTPEEALEAAHKRLRDNLAGELLQQLKATPPSLFERIVVELLVRMGYGGTRQDAGRAIGRSGDEGIDGIIKEDRLGLDIIYVQAKRWENTVGRPEVQKFAGALQGQRARKGIMISTSAFSQEAHEYASKIENKIVLYVFVYALLAYLLVGMGGASVSFLRGNGFRSDVFNVFVQQKDATIGLVLAAAAAGAFLAYLLAFCAHYNVSNWIGRKIKATNLYGEEDLWSHFHNSPESEKNDG